MAVDTIGPRLIATNRNLAAVALLLQIVLMLILFLERA